MASVKAPPLEPASFLKSFEEAAGQRGFRSEVFGAVGSGELRAFTRRPHAVRPRIYLSAGIHGDEPASSLALLSLVQSGEFDDRATWLLCPLLNPDGMARGIRENAGGSDLNRDYRSVQSREIEAHVRWLTRQPNFDLAVCLHEDWESRGFYLYELNPDLQPTLAESMIHAVSKVCPIELSPIIEGREAEGGIIRPVLNPAERELWPESVYLQVHHTRLSYTIESPSALAREVRIAALCAALRTAIALAAGTRR